MVWKDQEVVRWDARFYYGES